MKPDTKLTLKDPQTGLTFEFFQFEIPAEIPLGRMLKNVRGIPHA